MLKHRSQEKELMDTEAVSFREFHNCLRHLRWINIFTLAYLPTFFWLKKILAQNSAKEKISIYDIGSGGGDMLCKILKWTQKSPIKFSLTGIDINPWSKKSAQNFSKNAAIEFKTADIFALDESHKVDYVISSLFTHHLSSDELVKFICWMDNQSNCGWFINDLHRHFIPYFFIKSVTRILPFNRLVKNDAAVSVARGFTATEWREFLHQAGIASQRFEIKWFFPFRYGIACQKI